MQSLESMAQAEWALQNYAKGVALYVRVLALQPENAVAWFRVGCFTMKMGGDADAEKMLQNAAKFATTDKFEYLGVLSNLQIVLGKWTACEKTCREALAIDVHSCDPQARAEMWKALIVSLNKSNQLQAMDLAVSQAREETRVNSRPVGRNSGFLTQYGDWLQLGAAAAVGIGIAWAVRAVRQK